MQKPESEQKNSRTATGEYYDGEVETIVYLECLATALIRNGVEPKRAHNIVAATKYLSTRSRALSTSSLVANCHL
jgi:hypothetical protein